MSAVCSLDGPQSRLFFSGRLMDADTDFLAACSSLHEELAEYRRRYLSHSPQAKQSSQQLCQALLMAAAKRQAEYILLFSLDLKPCARQLEARLGQSGLAPWAEDARCLVASLVHGVADCYTLTGGRLLLAYYSHSPGDPELLADQIVNAFLKRAYPAGNPVNGQADTVSGQPVTAHHYSQTCATPETAGQLLAYIDAI